MSAYGSEGKEFKSTAESFAKDTDSIKFENERLKKRIDEYTRLIDCFGNKCSDGWWDWNIRNKSVMFSENFCSGLGYKEKELKAIESPLDLIAPEDKPKFDTALESYLIGRSRFEPMLRFRHQDGTYQFYQCKGTGIDEVDYGMTHLICNTMNVTPLLSTMQSEKTDLRQVSGDNDFIVKYISLFLEEASFEMAATNAENAGMYSIPIDSSKSFIQLATIMELVKFSLVPIQAHDYEVVNLVGQLEGLVARVREEYRQKPLRCALFGEAINVGVSRRCGLVLTSLIRALLRNCYENRLELQIRVIDGKNQVSVVYTWNQNILDLENDFYFLSAMMISRLSGFSLRRQAKQISVMLEKQNQD